MTAAWTAIGLLALATFAIRAAGPVWLGGRAMPPLFLRAIAALPAAMLAGLVVVLTFADGTRLVLDPRAAGTLVAGIIAWRGGGMAVALLSAAATAALIHAL